MIDERLDRIHIRDLAIDCIVGVNPEERIKKQLVVINITLHANLAKACASDRLEDTIDYKALKIAVLRAVENSQFQLIEALAERVAQIALQLPIARVDVSIDKPGALRYARSAAVEITRRKQK